MVFPVADGHCDFLYGMTRYGYELGGKKRNQVTSLADLTAGSVRLQLFACWVDTQLRTPPMHQCIAMIDAYERMLAAHPQLTRLTSDFRPESGRIATVLTMEGGEAIDGSPAALRVFKRLGVSAMTLTWNESNELSGAATVNQKRGLTALGKDVVDEMCRIGIAVDVSHLSDRGIDDVLSRATRPIFASHSNARAVHDSPRALSDDHIRAIAKQHGVIGVNFYYQQLTNKRTARITDIVRHIKHIVRVGGEDCCAIGSDFDGMQQYPADLGSARDFPALSEALLAEGLTERQVHKIFWENLHRYIVQFV